MSSRNGLIRAVQTAGAVLLATVVSASGAAGQQPAVAVARGSAIVEGTVIDVRGGAPVRRARVTVAGSGVVRLSDDAGHFVLDSMPSGNQILEVRAIGFRPSNQPLALTDGARVTVRIELISIPVRLDTVRTRASSQDIAGYEQRRNAHIGTYFDRDEIAAMKVFDPTDILRHGLGVRIDFAPGAPSVKTGGGVHPTCDPDLWIDGRWQRNLQAGEMDNIIPLDQIEHIEIYSASYSVPSQFINLKPHGALTCGAILVWTSVPPRKTRATAAP
jgi:carboxypeptidase family protein